MGNKSGGQPTEGEAGAVQDKAEKAPPMVPAGMPPPPVPPNSINGAPMRAQMMPPYAMMPAFVSWSYLTEKEENDKSNFNQSLPKKKFCF